MSLNFMKKLALCDLFQSAIYKNFWSVIWQLGFHSYESQTLRLGGSPPNYVYSMKDITDATGRHNVDKISCQRNLSVSVDNELAFRDHIGDNVAKANGVLSIIGRTSRFLDSMYLFTFTM